MLYPRTAHLNGKDVLVSDTEMVSWPEHLTTEHRILFLSGAFSGDVAGLNLLMALDTISHDPIKIVITSPGGELDTTFLFYDTMRMLQSPVETVGRYCASAAAMILAAGAKGKRYLYPHCKVMLHLHANYFQKDTVVNFQDMEIQQRESRKYKDKMVDILLECGAIKSRAEILVDMDRDFWLEPQEAIDYGLADAIWTPEIWKEWTKGE